MWHFADNGTPLWNTHNWLSFPVYACYKQDRFGQLNRNPSGRTALLLHRLISCRLLLSYHRAYRNLCAGAEYLRRFSSFWNISPLDTSHPHAEGWNSFICRNLPIIVAGDMNSMICPGTAECQTPMVIISIGHGRQCYSILIINPIDSLFPLR